MSEQAKQEQQGKAGPTCAHEGYFLKCYECGAVLNCPAAQPAVAQAEEIPELNCSCACHEDGEPWCEKCFDEYHHHGALVDKLAAALRTSREQLAAAEKKPVDWAERYRTMPPVKCFCGQMDIPAAIDGVQWYWQRHARTGCTLELPDSICWCGLKRSEHIDGHAALAKPSPGTSQPEGEKCRLVDAGDYCTTHSRPANLCHAKGN